MGLRDGSRDFGRKVGKFFEGVPILEDITETVGEVGEDFPAPMVCDYFKGVKEGVTNYDRKRT